MSKQEETKSIFAGSKQYLEKSFLEELNYKIKKQKTVEELCIILYNYNLY